MIFEGKFSNIFISEEIITKQVKNSSYDNELSIHSSLNHENIVSFISYDEKNKLITMEYCDQGSLKNCINFIDINKAFREICNGLKYLHDRNIIHRDIKPENILIKNNCAKICDFGLSIVKERSYIKSGIMGTTHYLSPEIVKKQFYNEKTDVWSLGCTFYFMIYKRHLFEIENKEEVIEKIKNADFYLQKDEYYKVLKNMLFTNKFCRLSVEDIINNNIKNHDENYLEEQNDINVYHGEINNLTIITNENVDPFIGDMLIFQDNFYGKIVNVNIDDKITIEVESLNII